MVDADPVLIWTAHARQRLAQRVGVYTDPAAVLANARRISGKKAAKLLNHPHPKDPGRVYFYDSLSQAVLVCGPDRRRPAPGRWPPAAVYGPSLRRGVRK